MDERRTMTTFDEWLKKKSDLSQEVIDEVDMMATNDGITFNEALLTGEYVDEVTYFQYLATYNETEFVTSDQIINELQENLFDSVSAAKVRELSFLPYKVVDDVLFIVVADIASRSAEDYAASVVPCSYARAVYTTTVELEALINKYFTKACISMDLSEDECGVNYKNYVVESLEESDSSISRMINDMIMAAIENNVSDIHISPEQDGASIRFRKDGILSEYSTFPSQVLLQRIVNKIKTSSQLKIEESRKTQSGHYSAIHKGNTINFRVSTLPTIHGIEKVTLRLLNQQSQSLHIDSLKLNDSLKKSFTRLIKKPQGIILITGPTGSGKTTTLYTALATIANPKINVVTLEDPAEYQLGMNIVQSQINHNIGMDFPAMLREVLRQDPDVILVGEIRDLETAQVAMQASNTGHLVFSTLHTNDSIGAVTRLIEIGVETYNVADALLGVMAQRLVRKVCPNCKQPHVYELDEEDKMTLNTDEDTVEAYISSPIGCPVCRFTGYKGRLAVHELCLIDDTIREILSEGKGAREIRAHAEAIKMPRLRDDGFQKMKDGLTTLEELRRVLG